MAIPSEVVAITGELKLKNNSLGEYSNWSLRFRRCTIEGEEWVDFGMFWSDKGLATHFNRVKLEDVAKVLGLTKI